MPGLTPDRELPHRPAAPMLTDRRFTSGVFSKVGRRPAHIEASAGPCNGCIGAAATRRDIANVSAVPIESIAGKAGKRRRRLSVSVPQRGQRTASCPSPRSPDRIPHRSTGTHPHVPSKALPSVAHDELRLRLSPARRTPGPIFPLLRDHSASRRVPEQEPLRRPFPEKLRTYPSPRSAGRWESFRRQ